MTSFVPIEEFDRLKEKLEKDYSTIQAVTEFSSSIREELIFLRQEQEKLIGTSYVDNGLSELREYVESIVQPLCPKEDFENLKGLFRSQTSNLKRQIGSLEEKFKE